MTSLRCVAIIATAGACHGGGASAAPVPAVVHPPTVSVGVAIDTTVVGHEYASRVGSVVGPLFLDSYPVHWEHDVSFVIRRDGSIRPEPSVPGDTIAARIALVLGRTRANPLLALPASAPDSLAVSARIASDPVDPPLRYATVTGDSARYPLDVDEVVLGRPGVNWAPTYPGSEQVDDHPGHAVAEFVVLADGKVDRSTIRIIESTGPAFAQSVAKGVAPMRFYPATIGKRPVPQVVELAVFFYTRPEDAPANGPPGSIYVRGFKTTTVRGIF